MTTRNTDRRAARRLRGDDGAALLEFALVAILLFLLIFGIINYGFMLSFKQDMTRTAAEGARAGAVAYPPGDAEDAARFATMEAAEKTGRTCTTTDGVDGDDDGLSCLVEIVPCGSQTSLSCVEVTLQYDEGDHPLVGHIPLLSSLPPNTLTSKSVARLNTQ